MLSFLEVDEGGRTVTGSDSGSKASPMIQTWPLWVRWPFERAAGDRTPQTDTGGDLQTLALVASETGVGGGGRQARAPGAA